MVVSKEDDGVAEEEEEAVLIGVGLAQTLAPER